MSSNGNDMIDSVPSAQWAEFLERISMLATTKKSFAIAATLVFFIVLTRSGHFATAISAPDATIALLFLGGILLGRTSWLALMIVVAFLVDAYAIGIKGVSAYCVSPAYWGLVVTYAAVWGLGRWLAMRGEPFKILPFIATGLVASSMAFVLSNAFWYVFSGRFIDASAPEYMSMTEFSTRIAHYGLPYVGYAMMYLGIAWVAHKVITSLMAPSRIGNA